MRSKFWKKNRNMLKKEIIWREILYQSLEKKQNRFQQKELAQKFGFSLSTVNNALKIPKKSGVIRTTARYFILENPEKMLYLWAVFRNLKKDIIYQTIIEKSPQEIEGLMPPQVIFGAYSAYLKIFNQAPADYDKVYVYLEKKYLSKIKERFPERKGVPNLVVLEADKFLKNYGKITPLPQTFVDIWNLDEWYAQDFYKDFKERINAILA